MMFFGNKLCNILTTDSPTLEKSSKEICPGKWQSAGLTPKTLALQLQNWRNWCTQQKVKARMQQHFNEVQKLVKLGEKSDAHAKCFATQFHCANPSPVKQRGGMTCSTIWQDNPISAVKKLLPKTAATLKQSRSNPQLLINSNNKICGVCRGRPRFHRCVKQTTPITDESINDKRGNSTHKVTKTVARCNICMADV